MGWVEQDQALHRSIQTSDFLQALDLVNRIGAVAEAHGHHPDLELGWGYVRIHITTHDAGGLTDKDRALAEALDPLLA